MTVGPLEVEVNEVQVTVDVPVKTLEGISKGMEIVAEAVEEAKEAVEEAKEALEDATENTNLLISEFVEEQSKVVRLEEDVKVSQWFTPDAEIFGDAEPRAELAEKLEGAEECVVKAAAGVDNTVRNAHQRAPVLAAREVCDSMLQDDEQIVEVLDTVALLNVPGSRSRKTTDRIGAGMVAITSSGRILLTNIQETSSLKVDGNYKTARLEDKSVLDDGAARKADVKANMTMTTDTYARALNGAQVLDVDFSQVDKTMLVANQSVEVEGAKPPPFKMPKIPKVVMPKLKITCLYKLPQCKCCKPRVKTPKEPKVPKCKVSCCLPKVSCPKIPWQKLKCCTVTYEKGRIEKVVQEEGPKVLTDSGSMNANVEETLDKTKELVTVVDESKEQSSKKQTQVHALFVRFLDFNTQSAQEMVVVLAPSVDTRRALKMMGKISAGTEAAVAQQAKWSSVESPFELSQYENAASTKSSGSSSPASSAALPSSPMGKLKNFSPKKFSPKNMKKFASSKVKGLSMQKFKDAAKDIKANA